ncbi:MAG: class I SAM-dependent methyltransferase [Spirochaetota bacterium]|nr:class I SAM-dependent methyltransferase [Spirochaetota bacterium]
MNKCIICDDKRFGKIFNDKLLKCKKCSFITANMSIDKEILEKTYTENYFIGQEYLNYLDEKKSLQLNFKKRLSYIYKKIGKSNISSVIEVGCAYGFFAEELKRELSSQLEYYIGFDVVQKAIDYGTNVLKQNLICGEYLNYPLEKRFTDAFFWDVIEHLKEPHKVIEKISHELYTGGRIYITTGDIDSFLSRIQKENWRMIHPPSHIHYFSKKTINLLLEKNGFKILSITKPGISRTLKHIYYLQFIKDKKTSKIKNFIFNNMPNIKLTLNTFDIMLVIAEKKI